MANKGEVAFQLAVVLTQLVVEDGAAQLQATSQTPREVGLLRLEPRGRIGVIPRSPKEGLPTLWRLNESQIVN